MPSTSNKQKRFMQAVANNPKFANKVGVPTRVGAEYMRTDTGKRHYRQDTKRTYTGPYSNKGDKEMKNTKKGVRKMQDGGLSGMGGQRPPSGFVGTGKIGGTTPSNMVLPPTPTPFQDPANFKFPDNANKPTIPAAPSDRMAARQAALAEQGNMGRGMDMRRVPTLPTQASQRARDMMASRMPITTPGGPTVAPPLPEAINTAPMAPRPMGSAPMAPGFKKGGRIKKKMSGGGATKEPNPRKGGALYNLGTNQNPKGMNTGGRVPSAPSLPSQASSKASGAMSSRFAGGRGMNKGGGVKKYASGGKVSRGDGCCIKGKTKGRMC